MPTAFSTKILSGYDDVLTAVRCIASTKNGRWVATGRLSGLVEVSLDGDVLFESDVRPLSFKANADRFLNQLAFSTNGDMLFVGSGVDVVCVNSTTGTLAWDFHPYRQFGFLKSVPQGLAVTAEDEVIVACSSGQMVKLDRKGRVVSQGSDNDSPQSMVSVAGVPVVVGTDGYSICAWDTDSMKVCRRIMTNGRYYALSAAASEPLVAVRMGGRIGIYDYRKGEWTAEVACSAGLPVTALSPDGEFLAFIEGGVPVVAEVFGNRRRTAELGSPAVTTSWVFREEKFGFGTADGRVEHVDFGDLTDRPPIIR